MTYMGYLVNAIKAAAKRLKMAEKTAAEFSGINNVFAHAAVVDAQIRADKAYEDLLDAEDELDNYLDGQPTAEEAAAGRKAVAEAKAEAMKKANLRALVGKEICTARRNANLAEVIARLEAAMATKPTGKIGFLILCQYYGCRKVKRGVYHGEELNLLKGDALKAAAEAAKAEVKAEEDRKAEAEAAKIEAEKAAAEAAEAARIERERIAAEKAEAAKAEAKATRERVSAALSAVTTAAATTTAPVTTKKAETTKAPKTTKAPVTTKTPFAAIGSAVAAFVTVIVSFFSYVGLKVRLRHAGKRFIAAKAEFSAQQGNVSPYHINNLVKSTSWMKRETRKTKFIKRAKRVIRKKRLVRVYTKRALKPKAAKKLIKMQRELQTAIRDTRRIYKEINHDLSDALKIRIKGAKPQPALDGYSNLIREIKESLNKVGANLSALRHMSKNIDRLLGFNVPATAKAVLGSTDGIRIGNFTEATIELDRTMAASVNDQIRKMSYGDYRTVVFTDVNGRLYFMGHNNGANLPIRTAQFAKWDWNNSATVITCDADKLFPDHNHLGIDCKVEVEVIANTLHVRRHDTVSFAVKETIREIRGNGPSAYLVDTMLDCYPKKLEKLIADAEILAHEAKNAANIYDGYRDENGDPIEKDMARMANNDYKFAKSQIAKILKDIAYWANCKYAINETTDASGETWIIPYFYGLNVKYCDRIRNTVVLGIETNSAPEKADGNIYKEDSEMEFINTLPVRLAEAQRAYYMAQEELRKEAKALKVAEDDCKLVRDPYEVAKAEMAAAKAKNELRAHWEPNANLYIYEQEVRLTEDYLNFIKEIQKEDPEITNGRFKAAESAYKAAKLKVAETKSALMVIQAEINAQDKSDPSKDALVQEEIYGENPSPLNIDVELGKVTLKTYKVNAKPRVTTWEEDIRRYTDEYLRDPSEINRKILEGFLTEEELNEIDRKIEIRRSANEDLGYDTELSVSKYDDFDFKANFVMNHYGSGSEAYQNAIVYLKWKEAKAEAAAKISKEEVKQAEADAGIGIGYVYVAPGEEKPKADDKYAFAITCGYANYVLAIQAWGRKERTLIEATDKMHKEERKVALGKGNKELKDYYESKVAEAKKDVASILESIEIEKTYLEESLGKGSRECCKEISTLMSAFAAKVAIHGLREEHMKAIDKLPKAKDGTIDSENAKSKAFFKKNSELTNKAIDANKAFDEAFSEAKKYLKGYKTITLGFTSEERDDRVVSLNKALVEKYDDLIHWLNGYGRGEWVEICDRSGSRWVYEAQTAEQRAALAEKRQRGLAYGIAGRMVAVAKDKNGNDILKKGVRSIENINEAVVGYFGDIMSDFADTSIARAKAMTALLNVKFDNKRTLREYIVELKDARENRAAERRYNEDFLLATTGGHQSKWQLDRDFQAAWEANYGKDDDKDIWDDIADRNVIQVAFVESVFEHTPAEAIGNCMWNAVACMKVYRRIADLDRELSAEFKGKVSVEKYTAQRLPGIWDMWHVQKLVNKELNYTWDGDMRNFAVAVCKAGDIIQKYDMGKYGSGSDWAHKYAATWKGGNFTVEDIEKYLSPSRDDHKNWNIVELSMKSHKVCPKALARALVEGIVPSTGLPTQPGSYACWDGCAGAYQALELIDPVEDLDKGHRKRVSDLCIDNLHYGDTAAEKGYRKDVIYGCARYADERNAVANTVKGNMEVVLWYGRLVMKYASEFATDVKFIAFPKWMEGLKEDKMPWKSYPLADLTYDDPRFKSEALGFFGNKETVITDEDVEDFSWWLKATLNAWKRYDEFNKEVYKPLKTRYDMAKLSLNITDEEIKAIEIELKSAKEKLDAMSKLGKLSGSQVLMDVMCHDDFETYEGITNGQNRQRMYI